MVAPGNILTGSINLEKLLLVLTSIGYWALKRFYMGGGIEGELKVNRLQAIPVPTNIDNIQDVTDVYKLYHFDNDEIKYIEDSLPEKGEK